MGEASLGNSRNTMYASVGKYLINAILFFNGGENCIYAASTKIFNGKF